jgi:4-amino-4-deoxy-L-arabinose transferase-like glycosyltransferase
MNKNRALLLVLVVVMICAAAIRLRLVDIPLERDEGEYAYAGQLLLRGVPPFAEAYNMKMPGIYAAYSVILAAFGESPRGIHLALLMINAVTTLLFYFWLKRYFERDVAALAAAIFALLSLSPSVQGIMANAEHFVLLFAVSALLVLAMAIASQKRLLVLASGLLFGIALLMKQHGIFLVAFGAVVLGRTLVSRSNPPWRGRAWTVGLFVLGVVLPFGILCLWLWAAGVFERFWFWTFEYARAYVSQAPLSVGIRLLSQGLRSLTVDSPVIWLVALVGVAAPLWTKNERRGLFYSFVVLSFLATCPGFFFRSHYFILFLPAVALAGAVGISTLASRLSRGRPSAEIAAALLVVAATAQLISGGATYFRLTPTEVCRKIYGANPFPESLDIGRYIRENTSEDETVAVLGSEPQIYFYSGRKSATGYVYVYALMERHRFALDMQKEMIAQIEAARPRFIARVGITTSWLVRSDSPRLIFQWAGEYLSSGYTKVAEYPPGERTAVELWERVD